MDVKNVELNCYESKKVLEDFVFLLSLQAFNYTLKSCTEQYKNNQCNGSNQ